MQGLEQDFRFGWRMVAKNPWMSAAAVVSLAGAMAVTIGGFSLVWSAFFATLPFPEGERIVAVRQVDPLSGRYVAPPMAVLQEWEARQATFEQMGAAFRTEQKVAAEDPNERLPEPVRYPVSTVTASGLELTGVRPIIGRQLTDDDSEPGAIPVVVVGSRVWKSLLGSDPQAVGRDITVGGVERTIVGVMPEGFRFPISEDLWIPFPHAASFGGAEPPGLQVFGRLAPGATIAEAEVDLDGIRASVTAGGPVEARLAERTSVVPYVRSDAEAGTEVLFLGAFAVLMLVLAIACASVANLLLSRAMARSAEFAVRAAMGARRARLIRQVLIEAWLLTAAGAVGGIAAARAGLAWFESSVPIEGLPFWVDLGINPATVAFAILAAFAAALLAGVVPALQATGMSLNEVLKDEPRNVLGRRFGRLSASLIVAEAALSVAFLSTAGLAAQSLLEALKATEDLPGERIMVAGLELGTPAGAGSAPGASRSIPEEEWPDLMTELWRASEAAPGVRSAVLATRLPLQQHGAVDIELEGGSENASASALTAAVSPGLAETFDGALLAGRGFGPEDTADGEPVAIVNKSFADRLLGGTNPVGRRFRPATGLPGQAQKQEPWVMIVGLAADLPMNAAGDRPAGYYRPLAQTAARHAQLAVRVDGDPVAAATAVKAAIEQVDDRIEVGTFGTHEELAARGLASYRMLSLVFGALGGTALFLATLGLYAVMSFAVNQRTNEIGIRIALGGTAADAASVVLRTGLHQVGLGLALGLVAGWGLQSLVKLIPVGISGGGPHLLGTAAAFMLAASLFASVAPTRRALRIQPLEALRHD